jgi:Putative Flp pilus-assembly TadE/G-like
MILMARNRSIVTITAARPPSLSCFMSCAHDASTDPSLARRCGATGEAHPASPGGTTGSRVVDQFAGVRVASGAPGRRGQRTPCRRPKAGALWSDRRGVSAVVLALSLSAILGLAGLAVDAGLWYNDKRTEQGVADLAAWTAMYTYYDENESTSAITDAKNAAQAVAAASGYPNGSNGVTVTVNNPPGSGPNKGVEGAFEVIINKSEPLFFSSPYLNTVTVNGRAVAGVVTVTTGTGAPGCIFAKNDITLQNGVTVNAPNCAVYANGSTSAALTVIGGSTLNTDGISVVGSITQNNGGVISDTGSKTQGASPVNDPYAGDTIAAAESGFNMTCPNGTQTNYSTYSSKPYALNPGVYCGGLSVSNGSSAIFAPGIYIIVGGTFALESGTNLATGVTIVLTGSGSNYAQFEIGNGATFSISPPTTGPTAGLAFFGDPNNTATVNFNGGAALTINGAVYFPGGTVNFSNNAQNTGVCTQLDAYNINFSGSNQFGDNCTQFGTQPIGGTKTTSVMKMLE